MKIPSKRAAKLAELEFKKEHCARNNDAPGFAKVVAEINATEQLPDEYTCICCGNDFPEGPHVEMLVASINIHGDAGVIEQYDWGIRDTMLGETGRRIKFCGKCFGKWKHQVANYISMR